MVFVCFQLLQKQKNDIEAMKPEFEEKIASLERNIAELRESKLSESRVFICPKVQGLKFIYSIAHFVAIDKSMFWLN